MIDETIEIRVNGELRRIASDQNLLALLADLQLDPQRVAVELNREIARRPIWPETILQQGDTLEIVEFVGGG